MISETWPECTERRRIIEGQQREDWLLVFLMDVLRFGAPEDDSAHNTESESMNRPLCVCVCVYVTESRHVDKIILSCQGPAGNLFHFMKCMDYDSFNS